MVWACALGFLSLLEIILSHEFYYSKGAYRRSDECSLCFGNDCLVLDRARCDYYAEADKIINVDYQDHDGIPNELLKNEVDSQIFDMIEKASVADHMECMPYISRYTDCNKDNICLGCSTCSCDNTGKWNCSITHSCHTPDIINIDHRVLVLVLENMIDSGKTKKIKRSVTKSPEQFLNATMESNASTYTLEEMSEWLFGAKPLTNVDVRLIADGTKIAIKAVALNSTSITSTTTTSTTNTTSTASTTRTTSTTATAAVSNSETGFKPVTGLTTTEMAKTTETTSNVETDNLAFEEVLRSIAVDSKGYTRRKQPLVNEVNNKTYDVDYMLMDEDNVTNDYDNYNGTEDLAYLVDFMQNDYAVTEPSVEGATKIIIDLLETANRVGDSFNETRVNKVLNRNLAKDFVNTYDTNDIIEYNALNIMKRDVTRTNVSDSKPTVSFIVSNNNTNSTDEQLDLKENALAPLNKIINDKKKEIAELNKIKISLLKHITKTEEQLAEEAGTDNNLTSTYFSIYNFAIDQPEPELGRFEDFFSRRAYPGGFDKRKTLLKLKSDILEVVRDILIIRKITNLGLPDDLKILMHAMKHYVYRNEPKADRTNKEEGEKKRRKLISRRHMEKNLCDYLSYKDCMVQIVDVIDRDLPASNALFPLSPAARKIMRHVVSTFYVDDWAILGQRVNNPKYNLTNELNNVGSKWHEMSTKIIGNSPAITLYRMKLLHLVLTSDINKMSDALSLVHFTHSRRMLHTLDTVDDEVLSKISNGLREIHDKIQMIVRYYAKMTEDPTTMKLRAEIEQTTTSTDNEDDISKKKKRSFIKHIRSLLKSSKKDIAELLQKKVPKSEIVKQLARKKLDEISEKRYNEYEETMKRWQKNLEISPRIKRSLFDNFKGRIKNIIPGYLRHKVSPKIHQRTKNATSYQKNHKTAKTTTPRMKRSNVHPTSRITTRGTQAIKYPRSPTPRNTKLMTTTLSSLSKKT